MATVLKYPRAVSQYTGGDYREFSNLENIKNHSSGSYATSNGNIRAKTGSPKTPSTITCTHFNFNLPAGAEVVEVRVTIAHRVNKVGGTSCNIPASPIELLNVCGVKDQLLAAPSTSFGQNHTYTFKHKNITREVVNSQDFGVRIKYRSNTGKYEGTLSVGFVNMEVVYKPADFIVGLKQLYGKVTDGYNYSPYSVVASITNKNGVHRSPTCTFSYPSDFDFDHATGAGTFKVNPTTRKVTWKPNVSGVNGTHYLELVFIPKISFGNNNVVTRTLSISEAYTGKSKSYTARIRKKEPITPENSPEIEYNAVRTEDSINLFSGTRTEPFVMDYTLTDTEWALIYESEQQGYPVIDGPTFSIKGPNTRIWDEDTEQYVSIDNYYSIDFDEETKTTHFQITSGDTGTRTITIYANYKIDVEGTTVDIIRDISSFQIYFRPLQTDLSTSVATILELTAEETYRLGDGFTYICQADMKHTTTDTFQRDWYNNQRIGVFNNQILDNVSITTTTDHETGEVTEEVTDSTDYDNLTVEEIITYADYWSENQAGIGEYVNVECEFTYNESYPIYIIITNDSYEASDQGFDMGITTYNNPCIVESDVYSSREKSGTYPISILDLIGDEDVTTLELEGYNTSSSFIAYEFDTDSNSFEDVSIIGFEVTANLEHADDMSLNAKIVNNDGDYGQRSINLSPNTQELVLGGLGDLWGFKTTELTSMEDFSIELNATGLIEGSTSTLTMNDLSLIAYIEPIIHQHEEVYIDDEPLSHYGCFIEKVEIDEGLNNDVAYINVAGTDTNDPYRQNIESKKIILEFYIDECDFLANTKLLDIVTELIVTKRDKYNRPIPNIIRFNHKEGQYYEYITEKTFDITEENGYYYVKAELTVPAGTSYSTEDTVTNTTGIVKGLAPVHPTLIITPLANEIKINETISGQSFMLQFTEGMIGQTVEINCEDRTAKLIIDDEEYDLSVGVDMGSDWFRLQGEYSFDTTECVLMSVTFNQRR